MRKLLERKISERVRGEISIKDILIILIAQNIKLSNKEITTRTEIKIKKRVKKVTNSRVHMRQHN